VLRGEACAGRIAPSPRRFDPMSGIAVLYQWDGAPADRSTVERMIAVIPYRSVDGSGVWSSGPVAIGHAKLATTPEAAAETSPFVDETSGFVLSMDGRVDNRDDLIAELNSHGHRVATGTDAEIVLRAWQCWGTEAPARVIGDFAFALWDESKRTLFCARDPLGVKGFYYFVGPGFFLCSSELHQLFQDPRVARRPNEPAVADILVRIPVSRQETLFEGVLRLEPAHYLCVSPRGVECRRYYDLDASREIVYRSDDEYADHFLSLFKQAVRCHLRSNKGVASDLSGGLDSSSIVCLTEQLRRDGEVQVPSFESFSVRFEAAPAAEAEYVEEVLAKYPHRHTYVPPGLAPLTELTRQVAHYLDLPDYPNTALADYTPLLANRDDLRVKLTGLGGDEWLTPTYRVYADMLKQLRLIALFRRMRADRNPPGAYDSEPGYARSLWRYAVRPLLPESLDSAIHRWRNSGAPTATVSRAFAAKTRLSERLYTPSRLPRCRSFVQQALYGVYSSGYLPFSLEAEARWSAGFRLEGRQPLLDRRILEFVFAIPDSQRFRPGVSKFVMRNAMRGVLPERVRIRPDKAEFGESFPAALVALGGERLFDRLSSVKNGWIDGEAVRSRYRSMMAAFSRGDRSYLRNIYGLWMVVAVELWLNVVFLGISEPFKHVAETRAAAG
jgi:asparagine synthase (glutamine-hydrolysing)